MKQGSLASAFLTMAAVSAQAQAQALTSGTVGGMPYLLLPASGGCSAATPCSIVTYLGYMDETQPATAADVQTYFGGGFAAANPHTIVIAPMITAPQSTTVSWGGYTPGTTPQEQQAVAVVRAIEQQYGTAVDARHSVVTGGSLGGDGTQAMLAAFGPKGTVQPGVFSAGLSFDAAYYAASPADIQALCGVPLTAVHGTADDNQPVTYDQGLQAAINGNPACNNSFTFVPVQGAGHGTWGGPSGYPAGDGAGSPLGWLATQLAGNAAAGTASSAPTAAAQPAALQTAVTPIGTSDVATGAKAAVAAAAAGSIKPISIGVGTGSVTDARGHVWTISASGDIEKDGQMSPGGGESKALTIINGTVYGEDSTGRGWFTLDSGNQYWTHSSPPPSATATGVPAAPEAITASAGPAAQCAAPTSGPVADGARDPTQAPFAATSVFNLPLGLNAAWAENQQLQAASVVVNTRGNYNENIYTSTAQDPMVTVTNNASAGGTPGVFHVHIPPGATGAGGNDRTFSVADTATGMWFSGGGFVMTGPGSASVNQGSIESYTGSGLEYDHGNRDQGVGTIRQTDLIKGSIDHMLRVEMPMTMLMSWSQSSTSQLCSYCWPQTEEDGFAINGNGGPAYSGTVPYGATIGIPALAQEPAAVAANPGADMLWRALQTHGAMIRDSGGSGRTVTFQTDQDVDPSDPRVQGMQQLGNQIMAWVRILTNQGPSSVNGGGTPITGGTPVNAAQLASLCSSPGAISTSLTIDQLSIAAATNTPLSTPAPGHHQHRLDGADDPAGAAATTLAPLVTGDTLAQQAAAMARQ